MTGDVTCLYQQDPEFVTKVATFTGMYVYVLYVRYVNVESSPKMCFVFFKKHTSTKLTQKKHRLTQN